MLAVSGEVDADALESAWGDRCLVESRGRRAIVAVVGRGRGSMPGRAGAGRGWSGRGGGRGFYNDTLDRGYYRDTVGRGFYNDTLGRGRMIPPVAQDDDLRQQFNRQEMLDRGVRRGRGAVVTPPPPPPPAG